jgi:hypothetical protein
MSQLRNRALFLGIAALVASACTPAVTSNYPSAANGTDPRVGLKAGLFDAGEAFWNMRLLSTSRPSAQFAGITNSDLSFSGPYAIQGSYNGFQVWDISNPAAPTLKTAFLCPASQSDVSVYKNLLFVSSESNTGRLDCGAQGVSDTVSTVRLRGLRIFDITDISNPKYLGNVQTCRGSHTHTVVEDPNDPNNVYVYISGQAGVRSPTELPGCSRGTSPTDSTSSLFRIEVIKVPLAHPEQAAIVSSPRIFNNLVAPPMHGLAIADRAAVEAARAKGAFISDFNGTPSVVSGRLTKPLLDSIVKARNGTGAATAADSAALRAALPGIIARLIGSQGPPTGPTQCHDITVYPAIGYAGGACAGYGFLLDIHDPAHPVRVDAVSDSNFSYWHSATFNNDGTKVLFSDEWGGGGQPKCRITDPREWGADAIFNIVNNKLQFQSYYKLPAPQTDFENCVAHNGSLIPIPGRDVMVQSWYQGGISVFDWTDAKHPREIAFFDRGPADSTRMAAGGTWSAYWYNGVIVSSEISRGLDILELAPSAFISQNELDAAKTVHFDYLNVQGQPKLVWPPSLALARAYLDQLERENGLAASRIAAVRIALSSEAVMSASTRAGALSALASQLNADANGARDGAKVRALAGVLSRL